MRHADDRYTAQRRAGYPWLRFERELEREYRDSFVEVNKARIRVGGAVGLAAVFGFILVDQFLGMNLEPAYADALLIAICVPSLAIPLAATFHPRGRAHLLWLIQFGSLGVSCGVLTVIVIGRGLHPWFPYESLVLVTFYIYFVSGLMFYQAMVCGVVLWLAFTLTNLPLQDAGVLLYESYYLLVANVLGWLGLYLLDWQARESFLMHNELRQQALLDSLTGLMNRRAFTAHLGMAWLQAQRGRTAVGLMLLDMDEFKRINDTCGHQFGDNALRHVAHVLRMNARRPLDAAARYGGDEFVALWYDVDGAWFAKLAQDLPERLRGLQCGRPDAPMHVTVSGGAVLAWPRPEMTVEDAVKAADEMLYRMKRDHRGTIGFSLLTAPAGASRQTSSRQPALP